MARITRGPDVGDLVNEEEANEEDEDNDVEDGVVTATRSCCSRNADWRNSVALDTGNSKAGLTDFPRPRISVTTTRDQESVGPIGAL